MDWGSPYVRSMLIFIFLRKDRNKRIWDDKVDAEIFFKKLDQIQIIFLFRLTQGQQN